MTLTDEIRGAQAQVGGWDPTGATGEVCRALVDLAATVARVQVLALVAAKRAGAMAGSRDVAAWLRGLGVSGRSARVLGDAVWCVEQSTVARGVLESQVLSVEHVAELKPLVELIITNRCDNAELADLLAKTEGRRVEELRKAVQAVVLRVKQAEQRPTGKVYESDADHGQKQLRSVLNPEDHEVVRNAIDRIVDEQWRAQHGDDTKVSTNQLPEMRALALLEMAKRSLANNKAPKASGEVIIIVDAETFLTGYLRPDSECRLADGTPVPPTAAHRLANEVGIRCYARLPNGRTGLSTKIRIEPVNLDLGRTRRLASYEQRLALNVEHATCATDNCTVPFSRTKAHHRQPWEHGGRTDQANLSPHCDHDHHRIHGKHHDRGKKRRRRRGRADAGPEDGDGS